MDNRKLILYAGYQDDTNCCHKWARASNAESERYRARVVTCAPHPYGYKEDISLTDGKDAEEQLERLAAECSLFVLTGTHLDHYMYLQDLAGGRDYLPFSYAKLGRHLRGKPVLIRHQGTSYRTNSGTADLLDLSGNIAARLMAPDLLLAASEGTFRLARDSRRRDYPYTHVVERTPKWQPPDSSNSPLRVLHNPSNASSKGTDLVRKVVMPLYMSGDIEYVEVTGVSHDEAMRAKARCDVYIDQIVPSIGGYGLSALEAMAMGVPAVASIGKARASQTIIEEWWKLPPVLHADNEEELRNQLYNMLDPEKRAEASLKATDWCARNVTPKAVSAFLDRVYDDVLGGYGG